jgi:tRNA uridine 5-carboxymethylaminomethyl modification enzyme
LLERKETAPIKETTRLATLLTRPQISYLDLAPFDPQRPFLPPQIIEEVEIEIKYRGYIERQQRTINEFLRLERKVIPGDFDYSSVTGLSQEAKERLEKVRPQTLGQASRIPGVTPSDVLALSIILEKYRSDRDRSTTGRA